MTEYSGLVRFPHAPDRILAYNSDGTRADATVALTCLAIEAGGQLDPRSVVAVSR